MDLIKTYINGFDDEIGGGIPKGHLVIVSGTPGTMKSSISLNMLYHNAVQDGRKCLYISLEEDRESLNIAMKNLNMKENVEGKLLVADMGTFRLANPDIDLEGKWLNTLKVFVERMITNDGFELVVVDSLAALYSLVKFKDKRKELFHFFRGLKSLGGTIFIITEMQPEADLHGHFDEGYLVDGIISLKFFDVGETDAQLRIKCVKMRHIQHYHGNLTLMFRGDEFRATHILTE